MAVAVRCQEVKYSSRTLRADAVRLLAAIERPRAELSVLLCDDEFIRGLNAQWRQKDTPTDVLSFPMGDDEVLGDIVISLDTAARQAAERVIRMATTTSTENSGLLGWLLPPFEKACGCSVRVLSVGSGAALKLGANGDADLVLVSPGLRSPDLEPFYYRYRCECVPLRYLDCWKCAPDFDYLRKCAPDHVE